MTQAEKLDRLVRVSYGETFPFGGSVEDWKWLIRGLILAKGLAPDAVSRWVIAEFPNGGVVTAPLTPQNYHLFRSALAGEGAIDYLYGVFIDG